MTTEAQSQDGGIGEIVVLLAAQFGKATTSSVSGRGFRLTYNLPTDFDVRAALVAAGAEIAFAIDAIGDMDGQRVPTMVGRLHGSGLKTVQHLRGGASALTIEIAAQATDHRGVINGVPTTEMFGLIDLMLGDARCTPAVLLAYVANAREQMKPEARTKLVKGLAELVSQYLNEG